MSLRTYWFALALLFIWSCTEPASTLSYFLENRSSNTLNVQVSGRGLINYGPITIGPGETQEVHQYSNEHGDFAASVPPSEIIDTFQVETMAGDTLQKDYRIQSNWEIVIEAERNGTYNHRYTLVVQNEDF